MSPDGRVMYEPLVVQFDKDVLNLFSSKFGSGLLASGVPGIDFCKKNYLVSFGKARCWDLDKE